MEKPTRAELENRFCHHSPKGDQTQRYEKVRSILLKACEECVTLTPCSREQTRAINAMDEAMMLFNASIARNEEDPVQKAAHKGFEG